MDKDLAEEHLVPCDKCGGSGYDPNCSSVMCDKCWGLGPLDWIEVIVGRDFPYEVSGKSASSSRSSNSSSRTKNTADDLEVVIWKV